MRDCKCGSCHGARLKPEALSVTVGGKNIYEFCTLSISDEIDFINSLELTEKEQMIGNLVIKEIKERLSFLNSVGLGYLSLSRDSGTLKKNVSLYSPLVFHI